MDTKTDATVAIAEFERKDHQRIRTGRIIVTVMAVLNLVGAIVQACLSPHFFTLLINIALSIALLAGVSWVRYFFAVCSAIDAFFVLYSLGGVDFSASVLAAVLIGYFVIRLLYDVGASLLLFFSKSVDDFLYKQKNG